MQHRHNNMFSVCIQLQSESELAFSISELFVCGVHSLQDTCNVTEMKFVFSTFFRTEIYVLLRWGPLQRCHSSEKIIWYCTDNFYCTYQIVDCYQKGTHLRLSPIRGTV